jgi:hypothetical protein
MKSKILAVLSLGFVAVVLAGVGYYVFPTPSNQGYAPPQPIPFSHKKHAGLYKIDCRYCHVGVTRSAHATVPALSVCMNCHRVVMTNSPLIQTLTKHYNEGKPIEWVRIHELPEHAHFNHKRHVTKGVSCETCHGDVKTMDRVVQVSPLTMGWCLDCHRNRAAPSKVINLVKPEHPGDPLAPASCSTCHY